jgi:hypothetical protein
MAKAKKEEQPEKSDSEKAKEFQMASSNGLDVHDCVRI